jgi:predicted TIM-barrel enzyme
MKLKKSIIGMIHLSGNNPVERALEEIKIYEEEGLHGIIIENYHGTTDDIIETLQCVDTKMKVGINILPNNYDEALLNASFYKADFIQLDHISGTYRKNTTLDKEDYLKYRNKYKDISVFGGVWHNNDMLIFISKVNYKIFYVPIKRGDELYNQGRKEYQDLLYNWYMMFGNGKD